ncbi:hypothetical protein FA95DRAFT_1398210 [Auriscalpium vulgare]|uniref:Uncharacterized protein n=1 Tax=Auriscalpium vulgare TaxID=40419 RepID=A0ACB8RQ89_9AGAM|nr:hypothetical protein FA95DRAFT_1398210 [Auriscalpium vulgare]
MSSSRDALWESGHDETVEVNQRALIDKVLARYSGEFTVFRELLQNSDDAGARAVEIRFETEGWLARQKSQTGPVRSEGTEAVGAGQPGIGQKHPKLPDLKTALVHQWSFKNNGMVFRSEDWSRLKKIAEGNPDEEKIGAFGVGFYSLFSVTEEPWVTSGGQWMNFYWKDKKDQLFARRGTLPSTGDVPDPWTTFQMALREPTPIPSAYDFTRFLVSSITFMAHLSEVSVYFDDKRLVRLSKDSGVPKELPLLRGLKATSPLGIMNVKTIQSTPLNINAEVVRWVYSVGTEKPSTNKTAKSSNQSQTSGFFSSLFAGFGSSSTPQRTATPLPAPPVEDVDLLEVNSSGVALAIFAASVDVRLDKKMTGELQRSTKKNPPSKLRFELIYTGKEEYDDSVKAEAKVAYATGSVFQGLRADLDGTGHARVFIGHSTGQTTGIGGHLATRFIPTVERESIDLVDRNVAVWNKELLYVGGFLARSAYELELANIKNLWDGAPASSGPDGLPDPELQSWLRGRALHALKFFTFHPSTPSAVVSSLMEASFFSCATTHPFSIISSEGVRSAALVHAPDPAFAGFLKRLPVIPDDVSNGAKNMVNALRARGMIKDITFVEVLQELRSRPLSEPETIACLKWWISVSKSGSDQNLQQGRTQLLDAAIVTTDAPQRIIPLSTVRTFLNPRNMGSIIPTDGPLPDSLLPLSISRSFGPDILAAVFPWVQLTIIDWLRHVVDPSITAKNVEFDISLSAPWAERVLTVLARAWPSLPKSAVDEIVKVLKGKPCVPTSTGLKLPEQAYFANVNLFRDLPIVTMPSGVVVKGALEKVLQALGVRKHVELQIVFDRMIKTGDWTILDLVKYLVSVQSTLASEELQRLQHTAAFVKEEPVAGTVANAPSSGTGTPASTRPRVTRHKASDLYEPVDIFRELQLPIIDWGRDNKWKPSSEEAKFLYSLGLRRVVPLHDIIRLSASPNATLRSRALSYFLENFVSKYSDYDAQNFHDVAFIPAIRGPDKILAKPNEVFASPEWAALGFAVISPELRDQALAKLKIASHPPTSRLVTLLEKSPPQDESTARRWFEVLSGRIPDFSTVELRRLSETKFVPAKASGDKSLVRTLRPNQCYFAGASGATFHTKFFIFVDFGVKANSFLTACGTKSEPSVEEIVQILLADPRQFLALATSRDSYLLELRNIAINRRLLSQATVTRMKRSSFLLGSRRVKRRHVSEKAAPEAEEEDWDVEDDLLKPDRVVIADDSNAYQLFGDSLFCAPQEDVLEDFYLFLGSPRLSQLVREDYQTSKEITNAPVAAQVRHLVLERLPLFLHEHSQSRTRVSFNWLNDDKNFVVKTFGKLAVTKTLSHGDIRIPRTQDASAVAKRDGKGPIQLWLAGNTEVDNYEVATSLCRFLFDAPKVNDALLFMTILSTDLAALRRRGYNIDRILRQQHAEREAVRKAARETAEREKNAISEKPPMLASDSTNTLVNARSPPEFPTTTTTPAQPLPNSTPNFPGGMPPPAGLEEFLRKPSSALQNIRRKLMKDEPASRPTSSLGADSAAAGPSARPGAGVTPLSNIAANIDMAIKACTEETNSLLKNRQQMQKVKESLDEGYCDVSGHVGDLDLVGTVDGVKLYSSNDLADKETLIHRKRDAIGRFLSILNPLITIFNLPKSSLHVFADGGGQLIAFNRNGSLFVNLRFYDAWHDQDVQRGDRKKALISWYFSLAHEIAHNLVQPHNSEHEFYFSSICEAYLMPLAGLLVSSS